MSGVWDPLRPELDTSPPCESPPSTVYFVCSTPRSGSGLLCRGLARTRLGGAPAEYFNDRFREQLSRRWRIGRDLDGYVLALRTRRTSGDGVFGAKLHWEQLEAVRRELGRDDGLALLESWFPGAKYVSIERDDVNRQAVSLWIAIHTDTWSAPVGAAAPTAKVPYSFAAIYRQRRVILEGRQAWANAFARAEVEPVRVTYEELASSFQPTVARVLEQAAGRRIQPSQVPLPDSRKQGGDLRSEELLRRFEQDLASGRTPSLLVGKTRTSLARRLPKLRARRAR